MGRSLRIVVADDDPDTVLMVAVLLRDEGHEVRTARNGTEAIAAVREFNPDVVFVDIAMPNMSGWDVVREIRKMNGHTPPLLVAMSGRYVQASDQAFGSMAGFHHYLLKPYGSDELLSVLEPLLGE